MSQHDFDIANQTSSNARADINNALKALASTSSGTSAPSTTYANMLWYDTSANILKMRAEADDAWINIGYLDQSADAFRILDDTQVVTTAGSQTGLLGDQATSAWQAGTGTTESLVSPAKIKAAILSLSPNDTWGYTSSATALSSNSSATFTHGLGAAPTSVEVDFVCSSANNGYAAGDRITGVGSQLQAASNRGFQILIPNGNTTQIKLITLQQLRFASATGSEVALLFTQWNAVVKARL